MNTAVPPLTFPTEDATARFAGRLAAHLVPGDVLLLDGPVGAGKSFFARALIRARLGSPHEEVPSPTFTLVQTYPHASGDIWHADLYRLTHPDEAAELGLEEAFEDAICLIEWPDRLGGLAPKEALRLTLGVDSTAHVLRLRGPEVWIERLRPVIVSQAEDT